MTGTSPPLAPFGGAAFIKPAEAAAYLGMSVRSVEYLVAEGKLRKVYPKQRMARITVESLLSYREAVEAGTPPRLWTQPGKPTTAPAPAPKRKPGLLSRWGLGGND